MTITHEARVLASPRVLYKEVGKEAVLLDLETETYFGLNSAGARRWKLLTTAPSVREARDRARGLEGALASLTGRSVSMTTRVDESIIGGVVARIGSVVYDGSVRRQLEKIRETLTREA